MSITKIADKLRDLDLITEQTYQKVKQLIESCDISCSTLMYEIQQDAANRYIQEYFDDFSMMNVNIAIQPPETITEEMRAELLQKLNQLFESKIISGNIYGRLKADIVASSYKFTNIPQRQRNIYTSNFIEQIRSKIPDDTMPLFQNISIQKDLTPDYIKEKLVKIALNSNKNIIISI